MYFIKQLFILVFVFLNSVVLGQDYDQAIEKAKFLIKEHQKMTNTPGVQVAVMIDDSLVWSQGFGYSDLSTKSPVSTHTKFRIASVSKSVTSVALGKMIDQSQIDLDRDIHYYLPEYPHSDREISLRQLASSTSGIRHYTNKDPEYNNTNYESIESSLQRFRDDDLLFQPGTQHHYSSYGWVLLSAVLEKATNQSFFEIMNNTWDDLGMNNTTFDYPKKAIDSLSKFYIYDRKKGRVIAPEDNRSYMYAGGGYLSTCEDLVNMGNTLINGNYLSKNSSAELFSPHILKNGDTIHYGLGWEVGQSRLATPILYHSGSMSSSRSHLIMYPEENVTFAILTNTGDQIFFNAREAQSIAELFVESKRSSSSIDTTTILGSWNIKTQSLRNKRTKGRLSLEQKDDLIIGSIDFKRSRKKKSFPIILTHAAEDTLHFISVSPMFMDFYVTIKENALDGYWLHDFNVKGIPEEDEYWEPNEIKGTRM